MAGCFIAFEGIDGCGKSTQIALLSGWLRDHGIEPLIVREPGGTPVGEQIRHILLDPETGDLSYESEVLLYAASRAELVRQVIEPALAEGRVVIADRFVDSSRAYQGAGREVGVDAVSRANELATGGHEPDLVVYLQISLQEAVQRRAAEQDDRIEAAGEEFFSRVHVAFEQLASSGDARWKTVNGVGDASDVQVDVQRIVGEALARTGVVQEAGSAT